MRSVVESDLSECLEVIRKGYRTVADQFGLNDDNTMLKKWYIKNGFSESHKVKFPRAPFTTGYMEMTV